MSVERRPNFLVLIADDHRGTELGHIPGAQASTPVLDALAARGVSFTQAHCQGSMQGAVCVPSRASLMTGRSIFEASGDPTGQDYDAAITIPAHLETFPQALRSAGYLTHAVGKWHNDTATFNRSFASGDSLMFGGMSDHYHVPLHRYDPSGSYPAEAATVGSSFSTDIFTEAAIRFLEGASEVDPFLLYVAFTAPHDPRTPPPGWTPDPATIDLPPNFLPGHPFDNGEMAVRDELLASHPRTESEIRQHIADYMGMIAHLDYSIGRILDTLAARGLLKDTIVIYTADHGLAVGQHGLMGKQNLYEHSLRIPLVMAGPGLPNGTVSDVLAWHADTNATIRHLANLDQADASPGMPLIEHDGNIGTGHRHLGAAYAFGQRMYRDQQHKLIRYWPVPPHAGGSSPGCEMAQLFDLVNDPWEQVNLATDPTCQSTLWELEAGLREWQSCMHDPFIPES